MVTAIATGLERPLAVVEHVVPAGAMAPLHVHEEDEALRVLVGRLAVHLPDETVWLEPGESTIVPAGTPHTIRAEARDARVLSGAHIRSPGRYEDFLRAVALPGGAATAEDAATLAVIAAAAGTEVLGPPGVLPG
jgi:quercetin dioxygenase-like cupin family protein